MLRSNRLNADVATAVQAVLLPYRLLGTRSCTPCNGVATSPIPELREVMA